MFIVLEAEKQDYGARIYIFLWDLFSLPIAGTFLPNLHLAENAMDVSIASFYEDTEQIYEDPLSW